jgi:soluble lytic murein transglycosylase-like protein
VARVQKFAEVELAFADSRRRAAERRKRAPRRRSPLRLRSVRVGALALVLLALLAESTRLEASNAKPPLRRAAQHVATARAVCPVPKAFRSAFETAAVQTRVPLPLLVATAYEESRMDPGARSPAGARGLLQVMPSTAHALRLDGDDPAANVLAGARYLRLLLDRFGSVELALSAYNAGPAAVERAGGAPTIATLRYVKNIEAREPSLLGC